MNTVLNHTKVRQGYSSAISSTIGVVVQRDIQRRVSGGKHNSHYPSQKAAVWFVKSTNLLNTTFLKDTFAKGETGK